MNAPLPTVLLRRDPKPKPLLIAVMTVAFLGGSCTVQKMLGPTRDTPSEQEVGKLLGEGRPKPLVAAAHAMLEEQGHVAERFHDYEVGFGLLLVTAYSFAFVFALRAFGFAPGSAKPLSTVALLVLPARVAVGAVDLAVARALEPATRTMAGAFAGAQSSDLPPEQAKAVAQILSAAAPWVTVAAQVGSAIVVCALFQLAWRYFQRPEVLAYFDRKGGPVPED